MTKLSIKSIIICFIIICTNIFSTFSASALNNMQSSNIISQNNSLPSHNKRLTGGKLSGETALPEQYKTPLLTSVKNQGSQGLCWSFAAMGCLEAFMFNNGFGEYDFSEEHPNFWATDDGNGFGWYGRNLGEGAWAEIPTGYLISWNGPVSEADVPYQNGNTNKPENYDNAQRLAGVTGIVFLQNNRESIKRAIMDYSAVSASYNTKAAYYNYDGSAYYSPTISNPTDGHAICVVGWDDNYPKENFGNPLTNYAHRPENNGAWLCKNSWGDSGGYDNGYLWISYEDAYLFNESYGTAYAITSVERPKNNVKLYQAEEYGATYKFPVKDDHGFAVTNCTFANVYDFDENFKTLDKIVFYTDSIGATYTIYYIPTNDNGMPDTDKNHWTDLSDGVITYNGYLCVDFEDYTVPDKRGAVGVCLTNDDGESVAIGVSEWMSAAGDGKMYFLPNVKPDTSFLIDDNGCNDILDLYKSNGDDIGGQISIKLIAYGDITGNSSDTDTIIDSDTDTQTDTGNDLILCGDANNDNTVNMSDVVYLQKVIAKLITPYKDFLKYSDVNSDGIVNLVDVTIIQKYIAHLITKLPI